jgi:3'-phosphoadenosine 5'-phosphosulfate sulfotransferase (PAPS reductase)/FAD synthetase
MGDIHVCAFSGGAASAKMSLIVANEHAYKGEVELLFHNTFTEDEDTYRFAKEASDYLQVDITDDSDGRDIWTLFRDEGILGNGRETNCSRILKQERSMNYLKKLRELGEDPILYVGFTPDEWERAQRTFARYSKQGFEVRFPLIEHNISKKECHTEIEICWNIKLPRMYEHYKHANCMPCIKGKKTYWGLVYKYNRDAWKRAVRAEIEHGHTIFTEAGSLPEELKNCLRLADKWEVAKTQESLFDTPCECIT